MCLIKSSHKDTTHKDADQQGSDMLIRHECLRIIPGLAEISHPSISLYCIPLIRIQCYSPPILLNNASDCSWLLAPTLTEAFIPLIKAQLHQQLPSPAYAYWDVSLESGGITHGPTQTNLSLYFSPHMPFAVLASLRYTVFVLKVSVSWITSLPSLQDQNQLLELAVPFIDNQPDF